MQIGLISGAGILPLIVAKEIKNKGYRVITVALEGFAPSELSNYSDSIKWINIGQANEIIKFLKKNDVKEVVLTGKVPKKIIFEREKIKPDLRAIKMLFSAKIRGDDQLLRIVDREFIKEGFKVIDLYQLCPEFFTPEGVLTRKAPSEEEWKDINFGFKIAKKIGKLDIGQTVVVKEMSVITVEAIEGTDETITRAGKFVKDAVVVKVSKPQQDLKLDAPVAGIDTIKNMINAKAKVLALEAGKTILIDRKNVVEMADKYDIIITGVREA